MSELLGLHGSWHSGLAGNKWVVDPKVQLQIWLLLSCRRVLHCWICSNQVTDTLFLHFLLSFLLLFPRTATLGCKAAPFILLCDLQFFLVYIHDLFCLQFKCIYTCSMLVPVIMLFIFLNSLSLLTVGLHCSGAGIVSSSRVSCNLESNAPEIVPSLIKKKHLSSPIHTVIVEWSNLFRKCPFLFCFLGVSRKKEWKGY